MDRTKKILKVAAVGITSGVCSPGADVRTSTKRALERTSSWARWVDRVLGISVVTVEPQGVNCIDASADVIDASLTDGKLLTRRCPLSNFGRLLSCRWPWLLVEH